MSKAKINDSTKRELGIISGGRCERCNQYLLKDFLTMTQVEFSEHAHIIADSKIGPRGDKPVKYKEGVDNLMLLCSSCHTIIDKNPKAFPIEELIKIKKAHEDSIYYLTGLNKSKKLIKIIYYSKIGSKDVYFNTNQLNEAVIQQGFYPEDIEIDLSSNTTVNDKEPEYYMEKRRDLDSSFAKYEKTILSNSIALFAIAPQPLLIYLGTKLAKISEIYVNQRSRKKESWNFLVNSPDYHYEIKQPSTFNQNNEICLILALSDNVLPSRIQSVISNPDIWIITVEEPNMNLVETRKSIVDFSIITLKLFSMIKDIYGLEKSIHVFPLMPCSLAVEFGRVWMPKANNNLIIYDQFNDKEARIFKQVFEI